MRIRSLLLYGLILLLPQAAGAASYQFSDVLESHPAYAAIQYLAKNDIVSGYEDGTFRPDQIVNRAEALKLIVGTRLPAMDEAALTSPFTDVPDNAWYTPFVLHAYDDLRIIDGPPTTTYLRPTQAVTRGEFLKMLLLSYNVDPIGSYGEITYALSPDVLDASAWFYPYIRYGLTASMINTHSTLLEPGKQLTRADTANMLYAYLLYRDGKRTQTLLSGAENDILTTFRMLEGDQLSQASYAAARAILQARGALSALPTESLAKATVKTAEGTFALTQAQTALNDDLASTAMSNASTAWHLAEKAKTFSSSINALATQVQKIATSIADTARIVQD